MATTKKAARAPRPEHRTHRLTARDLAQGGGSGREFAIEALAARIAVPSLVFMGVASQQCSSTLPW